jgi:hypothetical protein
MRLCGLFSGAETADATKWVKLKSGWFVPGVLGKLYQILHRYRGGMVIVQWMQVDHFVIKQRDINSELN